MFARSIAVLGAAGVFAAMAGSNAGASGRYHGGHCTSCVPCKTCYQKVVTPPVYKTVMEQVLVRPAGCTTVHTPPVYGTQPRQVILQPERQVTRYSPPVYDRVRVKQVVRHAHTKWVHKRGRRGADYKCEVHVPARYRKVRQTVMVHPGKTWVETRPAVTGVVHQKVMISPGSARQVCHHAEYRTVARKVMVSPGSAQWVPVAGRVRGRGRW